MSTLLVKLNAFRLFAYGTTGKTKLLSGGSLDVSNFGGEYHATLWSVDDATHTTLRVCDRGYTLEECETLVKHAAEWCMVETSVA